MADKSLANRFKYQRPTEDQIADIADIREHLRSVAEMLSEKSMDARCRALALTKLEEASMWANKGILFAGKEEA